MWTVNSVLMKNHFRGSNDADTRAAAESEWSTAKLSPGTTSRPAALRVADSGSTVWARQKSPLVDGEDPVAARDVQSAGQRPPVRTDDGPPLPPPDKGRIHRVDRAGSPAIGAGHDAVGGPRCWLSADHGPAVWCVDSNLVSPSGR